MSATYSLEETVAKRFDKLYEMCKLHDVEPDDMMKYILSELEAQIREDCKGTLWTEFEQYALEQGVYEYESGYEEGYKEGHRVGYEEGLRDELD